MKFHVVLLLTLFGILGMVSTSYALESIEVFDNTMFIQEDGTVQMQETIVYNFDQPRRGIIRTIPYRYRLSGGLYNIEFSDIRVYDEDMQERPFTTNREQGHLTIKIGEENVFIEGQQTYIIAYVVDRVFDVHEGRDELFWNVSGLQWDVPIFNTSAHIFIPEGQVYEEVDVACYVGAYKSTDECFERTELANPETQRIIGFFFGHQDLNAGEQISVAISFPEGVIARPSRAETLLLTLQDNWYILIPFIVFVLLLIYWYRKGKDPEATTIITQFDPPKDLIPSEIGTIVDEQIHPRDVIADIIHLAVLGYLKIERTKEKTLWYTTDNYKLVRLKKGVYPDSKYLKKLLDILFEEKDILALNNLPKGFGETLWAHVNTTYKNLTERGYFDKNPQRIRIGFFVVGVIVAISAGAFVTILVAMISLIITGVIIIAFGFVMPRRTEKGVKTQTHTLGLKDYLLVAEKDRIAFHQGPTKDPEQFERLLPFAIALGVEKEWAKQFEGIYDKKPDWYDAPDIGTFNSVLLVQHMNGIKTTATSSLSTPSASSSSGISGGFSGGGFGGGGGSSW